MQKVGSYGENCRAQRSTCNVQKMENMRQDIFSVKLSSVLNWKIVTHNSTSKREENRCFSFTCQVLVGL